MVLWLTRSNSAVSRTVRRPGEEGSITASTDSFAEESPGFPSRLNCGFVSLVGPSMPNVRSVRVGHRVLLGSCYNATQHKSRGATKGLFPLLQVWTSGTAWESWQLVQTPAASTARRMDLHETAGYTSRCPPCFPRSHSDSAGNPAMSTMTPLMPLS